MVPVPPALRTFPLTPESAMPKFKARLPFSYSLHPPRGSELPWQSSGLLHLIVERILWLNTTLQINDLPEFSNGFFQCRELT